MNKQEIEHLTKLQFQIDDVKRTIEGAEREITLYCGGSSSLSRRAYSDLYDQTRELILDHLNGLLADLIYQRDELVICKGTAEYKPIDILNNQIG